MRNSIFSEPSGFSSASKSPLLSDPRSYLALNFPGAPRVVWHQLPFAVQNLNLSEPWVLNDSVWNGGFQWKPPMPEYSPNSQSPCSGRSGIFASRASLWGYNIRE